MIVLECPICRGPVQVTDQQLKNNFVKYEAKKYRLKEDSQLEITCPYCGQHNDFRGSYFRVKHF